MIPEIVVAILIKLSLEKKATFIVADKNGQTFPESKWVIQPSPSYLEFESSGPIRIQDIKWVELDPVISKHLGTLVSNQRQDHTQEVIELLHKLSIPVVMNEHLIRLNFPATISG